MLRVRDWPLLSPRSRRFLARASERALLAVAVVIVGVVVFRDVDRIRSFPWSLHPGRLAVGTALELLLLGWSVFLWSRLLARFSGRQPSLRTLLRVWFRTNLAKYLPGGFWPLVTTATMAEQVGSSPAVLPVSFLLHGTYSMLGALAVAGVLAGRAAVGDAGVPVWLFACGAGAAILLVHPAVLRLLVRTAARVAKRGAPDWEGGWASSVGLLFLYALTWIGYGFAFSLFVSALVPVGDTPWWQMAGMNALAFVAGFAAIVAPGGLGVREAALAVLLVPVVPSSGARVLLSVASRLWLVGTELLAGALVLSAPVVRARRLAASPPRRAVPPDAPPVLRGNEVEVMTGSGTALGRIAEACRSAHSSVWIAQLALDADCISEVGDPPRLLVDALLAAAGEGEGRGPADVRVLLNGSILMNTVPALRRFLREAGPAGQRVRVRGLDAFPQIMHAKLVLIDGAEAFLVGSPFVNGYWDDGEHRPADPARSGDDLGGRPIHDLSLCVRGPAVTELGRWFAEVWNEAEAAKGEEGDLIAPAPEAMTSQPGSGQSLRVLRTVPSDLYPMLPQGRTEIRDAYVRAIHEARSLIYIENQYFSSRPVRAALERALDERPDLEVILVLNQNPDITGYRAWQNARLREGGLLDHPRVGVFSLWAAVPSRRQPGVAEVTQLFIHSKTAVIDDAWATLGTANLDGVSLDSYGDDFLRWPGQRIFRGYRNLDLNLELLDGRDGEPQTGVAAALRRRLWARHLGVSEAELGQRPADGWLSRWRAAAQANVEHLGRGDPDPLLGHLLPYTPEPRPRDQLRALGVDPEALDLRFDPGWVEVLWSPGWLKKVIPEHIRKRL